MLKVRLQNHLQVDLQCIIGFCWLLGGLKEDASASDGAVIFDSDNTRTVHLERNENAEESSSEEVEDENRRRECKLIVYQGDQILHKFYQIHSCNLHKN